MSLRHRSTQLKILSAAIEYFLPLLLGLLPFPGGLSPLRKSFKKSKLLVRLNIWVEPPKLLCPFLFQCIRGKGCRYHLQS